MEEAAAGAVVGATIQVLLQKMLSFSVEEIGLIWNFNKELQKFRQSLVIILDFLEDAEMKQVIDKPVKRWLMKLEAVSFDANHIFDELSYQILRKQVETDKKMKKEVRSFFSPSNPILFRHKMARKINGINKDLRSINQEASELGLQMRISGAHTRVAETEALEYSETDSFTMDRIFIGRENDVTKIVEMVNNSPTEHVVSVFPIAGMGGLGKTTLARKVYNHENIVSQFENRIWVYVSEKFVVETVFKHVVASLTGENVDGSREVVLRKLREKIGNNRYLLVLDNVWNVDTEKWENFITSLEGISSAKGNVIILTTRKGNVASIVKTHDIHELQVLSGEDCWSIIKAKAFGGGDIHSQFETIGANIAKRCGGLPVAARVVGSLLRGKSKDEWVYTEKSWILDFGGDGNTVSKILKLSFDSLGSPSLKKCFAFCSIIPRGKWVEKDQLIHLWMAEGLLQTDQEKDMEMVGNRMFNLLVQSSLLQVLLRDDYGNVKHCGMHDLVHDLASSVLNPKFLGCTTYQVRYMSRFFMDESYHIPKEHAKCLRVFNGKVSHIVFSNFKCLHILILNDEDINELPIEIGKLISLRYLDISHTRIECLPDSIGDLYHLQTLRATIEYGCGSYLRKLPHALKYLVNLRHLYIPHIKLPPEIGKLISLQTLPYFQVDNEEGCGIMELRRLKNLKGEIQIHNLEKVRDSEEGKSAELFHKPNIFKLRLMWNESIEGEINDENVLEGLQPHPNLKSLEINGFKGRSFPLWTLKMAVREDLESCWLRLDNLIDIKLSGCKECEEIPMLGHLPHLKSLYLHQLSKVKSLSSSFYGIEENKVYNDMLAVFPSLQRLELKNMASFTVWEDVQEPHKASVFRRLEYLEITNCMQLMSAPTHFPSLKELEIFNMESGLPLTNICGSNLTSLVKLRTNNVNGLKCLPTELFNNNRDLLELEIIYCNNLTHLVPSLGGGGSGASLSKLVIENCSNFSKLPDDLHSLNELRIWGCPNLKSIQLSQQGFTSLRELVIYECTGLTNLPIEMVVQTNLPIEMVEACTPSLEVLLLSKSKSLMNLPEVMNILHKMPCLTSLGIVEVPKFCDLASDFVSLDNLKGLSIGGCLDCGDYDSFKVSLDRFFPALQSLRSLNLYGMEHWDALPDQLRHLTALHDLYLYEFGIEELPEWLGNLLSLKISQVKVSTVSESQRGPHRIY